MQERIKERLEDHLSGRLPRGADPAFDSLLENDPASREILDQFTAQARLVRNAFRVPAELAPAPGFYARVIARVEAEQARPSFWSIFTEPFGRRLIYASAALLVLMGVAMFSTGPSPEAEMAEAPARILVDRHPEVHLVGNNTDEDRGRVLTTLTVLEQ